MIEHRMSCLGWAVVYGKESCPAVEKEIWHSNGDVVIRNAPACRFQTSFNRDENFGINTTSPPSFHVRP